MPIHHIFEEKQTVAQRHQSSEVPQMSEVTYHVGKLRGVPEVVGRCCRQYHLGQYQAIGKRRELSLTLPSTTEDLP